MVLWKVVILCLISLALFGVGGIWVLNTLFGLGLTYGFKTWAAVSLGLFLINSGRAVQSITKTSN